MSNPNDFLSKLNGLPVFPGGRRQDMVPLAFDLMELGAFQNTQGKRLVDMTSGGGAASLYAKMLGYEVHSFDLGAKQALICQALLVETEPLDAEPTITRLLRGPERSTFLQANFTHHLLPSAAEVLDRIAGNCESPTDWHLAATLLGNLRRGDCEWPVLPFLDPLDPKLRVQELLATEPAACLRQVMADLNTLRFKGQQPCFAYREDSRSAIMTIAPDVVLLDPPSLGIGDYESGYYVDECYLAQRLLPQPPGVSLDKRTAFLESFLVAAAAVPELCFWNPIDFDSLNTEAWLTLLQRHRGTLHKRVVFHGNLELVCYSPLSPLPRRSSELRP